MPRSYASPMRAAASSEKRSRIIEAAARLLRENASVASFSLEAVAREARVSRLTVYHQFGSRRGLLEAVFDEIAIQGGLTQIAEVMVMPNPHAGLDQLIGIFCKFWNRDPAVGRLHDAMAIDPEFAEALLERNERRRQVIDVLIGRIMQGKASASSRRDAVDLIFALTSFAVFRMLGAQRSPDAVGFLIKAAYKDVIDRLTSAD